MGLPKAARRGARLVARLLLGVVLGLTVGARPAIAESAAPTGSALAESLFLEAKDLARDGDYDEACPKFAESHRLDPQLGTLLHLATCHEQQGKTASAWAEFREAADWAGRRDEPARQRLARQRARALEPKLARLVVEIEDPPAGLEIQLDGQALGLPSLATPLPVDPGEHELAARAPGAEPWSRRFTVRGRAEIRTIRVPPLQPAAGPKGPAEPLEAESDEGSGQRIAGWTIGAVGLAGLVVMAVAGLRAVDLAEEADSFCEGRYCTPEGLALHDDAGLAATISTVGFVVAVVGLGTGITLVATAPSSEDDQAAWLAPVVSTDGAGVSLGVRW